MYPIDAVNQVTGIAEKIQSSFAVNKGIALAQAINIVEPVYGNTLQPLREILPPAEHETGFMNATELGKKLGGVNPRTVNKILSDANLQYKDGKDWRLTSEGQSYGEEMPYTRNGHNGYQIRWSEELIDILNK